MSHESKRCTCVLFVLRIVLVPRAAREKEINNGKDWVELSEHAIFAH